MSDRRRIAAFLAVALFAAPIAFAVDAPPAVKPADPVKPAAPKPPAPKESATEPKPKTGTWTATHDKYVAQAKEKAGNVDLLFVGDSITAGWNGQKKIWESAWGKYKPHNIGIGGDRTQHVIWRLQNGEVAGLKPKVTVLMIGTNNLGGNSNEEIVAGITACVAEIKKQMPETKVLLLGVFPRSPKATDAARPRIKAINTEIAKLDDGKTVKYLDIGEKFLEPDGTLTKEVMNDFLHLTPKGYQIWADNVGPVVEQMIKG
ncbi:MAG TPA: GDSL-type esterase/lipase family protein [Tepidisphaeraceae bacterium]|nr:GDSL-type esterase/lipase family protein [Tepidisphaeraceae bacterium]